MNDDGGTTDSAAQPDLMPPLVADPLFVDAVDEAIIGEPFADSQGAQPGREIVAPATSPTSIPLTTSAARPPLPDDPHDIEDVVQETPLFLAAPELETELQALALARRVLTNLCIDRYRARKRRPSVINIDQGVVEELFANDEPVDPVIQAEDAAVVRQALALLSPASRCIGQREVEEKPLKVISSELGVASRSRSHLLFRARRALRRLLVGARLTRRPARAADGQGCVAAPRRALAATSGTLLLILLVVALWPPVLVTAGTHRRCRMRRHRSSAAGRHRSASQE